MKRYSVLFFGALLLAVYGYAVLTDQTGLFREADGIYLLAPFVTTVLGILAYRRFGGLSNRGLSLLFVALGSLSYLVGELIWYYIAHVMGVQPETTAADIFFLAAYPLFLAGVFIEYRLNGIRLQLAQLQNWIGYLVAALVLVVGYFGILGSYSPDQEPLMNALAIGYGISDLCLTLGAGLLLLMNRFGKGQLKQPWLWIAASFGVTLVTDLAFLVSGDAYYDPANLLTVKMPTDFGWILSYVLMAQGMVEFIRIASSAQDFMSQLAARQAGETR